MSQRALAAAPEMNTTLYRTEFAAYHSSRELAHYQHQVGSQPQFRIDRIRADYGDLFTLDAIADLQSQRDETRTEAESEIAGLRALLNSARLEHLEIQANEASKELALCEASIHRRGEAVSLRDISIGLANEPNKTRRDELVRRWGDAASTCDDLRFTRLQHLQQAAGTLDFGYCELIAEATRTNLGQVQRDGEELLKQTETIHRRALSRVVTSGLTATPLSQLNFADLDYLERLPWLDKFFSTQSWSKIYAETMGLLGIRVDKQPNLEVAFANPPLMDLSAACFPVQPPRDVRLIFSTRRTAYELARSLHVSACAQQHAWCSQNLADKQPEFIYSSDSATNESYGYLFSFLLLDRRWIQQFLAPISETQAGELARDVTAVLALRVRRLAAETSYAMLLHAAVQPSPEQLQSAFVDLHYRATAIHFIPELYLQDLHERISSAGHLRALAFAASFREYLRGRYGNRWWTSRKAGDELIDLWNTGSRYSVEELAKLIGFEICFELITELLISNLNGA